MTDILPPSARQLARMANATLARPHEVEPAIPAVEFGAGDFAIDASEFGGGCGASTPRGELGCLHAMNYLPELASSPAARRGSRE